MKRAFLFFGLLVAMVAPAQHTGGGGSGGGSGSGTVSAGTVNTVPKYTAATTVGNSTITDNGTTVTVNANLAVTGTSAFGTLQVQGSSNNFSWANGGNITNAVGVVTSDVSGNVGIVAPSTAGNVLTSAGGVWTSAPAAGGGITNGAGNNVITKSNGTNLVASSLTDNGTTITSAENLNVGNLITSSLKSSASSLEIGNTGGFGNILLHPEWHIQVEDSLQVNVPTIHAGTCGTSPSITSGSTSNAIEISVGTGGVATSCQVDFGEVFNKSNITHPICTANSETDIAAMKVTYSTGASVIITAASAFTASSKISVLCF